MAVITEYCVIFVWGHGREIWEQCITPRSGYHIHASSHTSMLQQPLLNSDKYTTFQKRLNVRLCISTVIFVTIFMSICLLITNISIYIISLHESYHCPMVTMENKQTLKCQHRQHALWILALTVLQPQLH